jgi:hypothetical protein
MNRADAPGIQTSEYERTKMAGRFSVLALILGGVVAAGPELLGGLQQDSRAYLVVGAIIAGASFVHRWIVDHNYVQARTALKIAQTQDTDGGEE